MLERYILKQKAREALGNNIFSSKWLMASLCIFIVTVIIQIAAYAVSLFAMIPLMIGVVAGITGSNALLQSMTVFAAMYFVILAIMVAVIIFISGPLQIGTVRYFLANRDPYDRDCPTMSLIFSGFKKNQYMKVVKVTAWRYLMVFLWTLIPLAGIVFGIIKNYEYIFAEYLAADNPDIGYREALKKSQSMTEGQKGKLFVMQLSFIGWMLLGSLCCGVGTYFASAYMLATWAEAYDDIKKFSISRGIITPADIGFDLNGDPNDPFWQPLDLNNPYIRNRNYSRMANGSSFKGGQNGQGFNPPPYNR